MKSRDIERKLDEHEVGKLLTPLLPRQALSDAGPPTASFTFNKMI
jgi:hypothetical protein